MRVVFNSSPLIVLGKLGYLDIVVSLFEEALVPEGVLDEIMAKEDKVSLEVSNLINMKALEVREPKKGLIPNYSGLHRGELEAIALAKEMNAIVVLDDLKARKAARLEGLRVTGTLGILKVLRDGGLIEDNPKELLNKLNHVGFRIRPELFYEVMGGEK
ncbi:DUF3368 domain-containing protein [Thermococcus indicus]|uniref:DUF3368 domain-containing protein n=1 Tax=Thermococcus indicus TaxID=2586643 RepID=A0A4Y5SJY6_9EURY|nr:DUF3368 domain-containing protein [Thermococcus indicus]QDA30704.1 DUF3368 domain-containing protein [Thermococcus indicus]